MSTEEQRRLYSHKVAARMARISVEFLVQCEREQLIEPRGESDAESGYDRSDVARLARIRRLREDLELELPAIGIVLRMRERVIELIREIEDMERSMANREEELLAEIRSLRRRIAEDVFS